MGAFVWLFASGLTRTLVKFLVLAILARLLPVEAFGLLGQAMVVVGFASVLSEVGVAPALIQRRDLTPVHIRVAFTLSVILGAIVTAAVWLLAPWAAALFRSPDIVPILRLISVSFVLYGFGTTSSALLQRALDLRRQSLVSLVSYTVAYGVGGITLALMGLGVWALAWASVIEAFLRTALFFWVSPHPVKPSLSGTESKQILTYGFGMSLGRILNYLAQNGDYFVVGRWLGAAPLGLYTRSYQMMTLPTTEFSAVLAYVLFPAHAEIQHDAKRLGRAFLGSVTVSAIFVAPALAALVILAPEIIIGAFGAKWVGAIAPLRILGVGGFFLSMYNLGDSLARATGVVYAQAALKAVYVVSVFVAALLGSRWGISGVAVGVLISLAIQYVLMAELSVRVTHVRWGSYLAAQVPGLFVAAAVSAAITPIILCFRALDVPPVLSLAVASAAALMAARMAVRFLPRRWLNDEAQSTLQQVEGQIASVGRGLRQGLSRLLARWSVSDR
jgi:PST family polysaccharide transporter